MRLRFMYISFEALQATLLSVTFSGTKTAIMQLDDISRGINMILTFNNKSSNKPRL